MKMCNVSFLAQVYNCTPYPYNNKWNISTYNINVNTIIIQSEETKPK